MNDKKDGGYVYPQGKSVKDVSEATGGMTLLDYFAGQAMQAMLTNPYLKGGPKINGRKYTVEAGSYVIAMSMVNERDKL